MTIKLRFFPLFSSYIYKLCSDLWSIRYSTASVLQSFQDDGIRYLELRTTPREIPTENISKDLYVSTVLSCIHEFPTEEMGTRLILSIDRRNTAAEAMEVVDLAIKYQSAGVVGVDLCGDPRKGNVSTFVDAFTKAKRHGLGITLHFAETLDSASESELKILLDLKPDRLGHVIHVPNNIKEEIISRGLGLELCLSCNILANMTIGGFRAHHFGFYRDKGCPITLCVSLTILKRVSKD